MTTAHPFRSQREVREAEMLLDGTSLRSDVARLQRATGMSLALPTLADALQGDLDDATAAAKLQAAVRLCSRLVAWRSLVISADVSRRSRGLTHSVAHAHALPVLGCVCAQFAGARGG